MTTARPALGAYDLAGKGRDFGVVRVFRHVDQALVSARIVEAGGDEALHTEVAHVAEGHRGAPRLVVPGSSCDLHNRIKRR